MGLVDRLRRNRKKRNEPGRVVDLAAAEARLRVAAGKQGVTVSCPRCAADGEVDRVDLVNHTVDLHCVGCGYAWQVDEAELTGT